MNPKQSSYSKTTYKNGTKELKSEARIKLSNIASSLKQIDDAGIKLSTSLKQIEDALTELKTLHGITPSK